MTRLNSFLCTLMLALACANSSWTAETGSDLNAMAAQLQQGITDLARLNSQIETAPEIHRDALIYRRDDRSFKLLVQLQELVDAALALPEDDPVRQEVLKPLRDDLSGAGTAVLARIAELGDRIATMRAKLGSLSGGQLVGTEAYIQNLDILRLRYYEALVAVIEGRKSLGIPAPELATGLLSHVYLHSEILVGRIEFNSGALDELATRQQQEPDNADVLSIVSDLTRAQQGNLEQLEALAGLLERLGEDADEYHGILLQQQGLSIESLQGSVITELLKEGWAKLQATLVEQGPDLMLKTVIFVLILLIFRFLSRLTRRAVKVACERPGMDISALLKDVLQSVCGGVVMAIGILMALAQVGISLGPMLAGLGVAGFVVGFALQDTLGNFAAGGMILIYRPYDVDDFVEVAGASGLVKKMSLVSTTIVTYDNQTLVIPNSKIWGDVIKNVTAQKLRRVDLEFGIGYSDDIEQAEIILHDILEQNEMVLARPEPMVKVNALADSSVNLAVRPWVKTEDYWDVYWDITREVKMRFDREGVSIPFPQRDMHIYREDS